MYTFATTIILPSTIHNTPRYVELPRCQQSALTRPSDTLCIRPVVSCVAFSSTSLAVLAIGPFAIIALHLSSSIRSLHAVGSSLIMIIGHLQCWFCHSCRTHGLRSMPRKDCQCSCRSLGSLAGRHLGRRGCCRELGLRQQSGREPRGL